MSHSDETFEHRWGIPTLDAGYLQVPNVFMQFYSQVEWEDTDGTVRKGLSNTEWLFVLHLAVFKYERPGSRSIPSVRTIAKRMNLTQRQIRRLRAQLERKGFLRVTQRRGMTSIYDFTELSKGLMALATERIGPRT